MLDRPRRWWTWPRVLFAVWSHILTAWTAFALTTHSMPRKLPIVMLVLIIVMPIVAAVGEFYQSNNRQPVLANPTRRRDVESVVPPDVDPIRRREQTALILIGANGAPRQRIAAAAPVSHGTEYRSANCEPEPRPEPKPKKPKRTDVPPLDPNDPRRLVDMDERTDPRFQRGRRQGFADAERIREELDDDDPPAKGPAEGRQ